jgi:oxygen-independent coproporphyrinogen-3 oxidase
MLNAALYIHIPWCIRKCPYCDFNSHKSPELLPEQAYIQALLADIKEDLDFFTTREISSIFIGGGTPSLFSGKSYALLLKELQNRLVFAPDIEITLEANPGTVEQARFNEYRDVGINRLSLGIQSFNAQHLKILGRIHDETQAHRAIITARAAGFDNINLDLMHTLPNQTFEEGLEDLKQALSYHPEHLSWYQLTIEPNTLFYKKPPSLPKEEIIEPLEEMGFNLLAKADYKRYEISAFSKKNKESQHNMNYWLYGDYFGIGAGAHGKLTMKNGLIYRTVKHRQPKDYLNSSKPFMAKNELINTESVLFEFMLNTTRLEQSIPYSLFKTRTGLEFENLLPKLKLAQKKGLLFLGDDFWQITPLGRRYTNNLQELFLPC